MRVPKLLQYPKLQCWVKEHDSKFDVIGDISRGTRDDAKVNRNISSKLPNDSNEPALEESLPTHTFPEVGSLCRAVSSSSAWRCVDDEAGSNTLPPRDEGKETNARIDIEHQRILAIGLSMVLSTLFVEKNAKFRFFQRFKPEVVVHFVDSLP